MSHNYKIHKRKDDRWYARFKKGLNSVGKSEYGYVYGKSEEEVKERLLAVAPFYQAQRQLNLLILGAGMHGRDVKEIAESLHIFKKIRFLDDKLEGDEIIGRCDQVHMFREEFPCAFIAIGDNEIRKKYAKLLIGNRFLIPTLIAPSAEISVNAEIGEGTVVMPRTNLGAVCVNDFCIVASGCIINSGAVLSNYTRVDSGAIVPKGIEVPEGVWIQSGEVYTEIDSKSPQAIS